MDPAVEVPSAYPGTRLRAMVRDPGTVYVYWEQDTQGSQGWEVAALDAEGNILDSFTTDRTGSSGYLKVPHGALGQVQLRRVLADGAMASVASTWLAAPRSTRSADVTQRWVEVPSDAPRTVRVVNAERFSEAGLAILDVGEAPGAEDAVDETRPAFVVEDLPSSQASSQAHGLHLPSSRQAGARRDG